MLTVLAVIGLLANVALAADHRLEISKPDGLSMQLFETAFFAACDGFPYARTPNNSFSGGHALFEPGDSQGNNNETTALAYCVYYSPDGSPIQFTAGVAQLLGGNTSTPCDPKSNACYFQYQADGAFVAGSSTAYPTLGYQYTEFDASTTGGIVSGSTPNTATVTTLAPPIVTKFSSAPETMATASGSV